MPYLQLKQLSRIIHQTIVIGVAAIVAHAAQADGLMDDAIAERYLSHLGDGNYKMLEPFQGFGRQTKILHKTCGSVRNINFSDMIWGRRACTCEAGVDLEEIQRRIDPTKTRFRLLEYNGARGEGQFIRVQCLSCDGESASLKISGRIWIWIQLV